MTVIVEILVVAVALVPCLLAVFLLRNVRRSEEDRRLQRWRIQRGQWLAMAVFFLAFAFGNLLLMAVSGEVTKYLAIVVPTAALGVLLLAKAGSTAPESAA